MVPMRNFSTQDICVLRFIKKADHFRIRRIIHRILQELRNRQINEAGQVAASYVLHNSSIQSSHELFLSSYNNRRMSASTHKDSHDFLAKVIIIGDSGVGKTNLLTKFCQGVFKDSYVATIGVDFKLKTITVDDSKVKLQIWDTAGQERFRNITQTYYKGASGIILAYGVNNKQSFKNISTWIKQIETNTSENTSRILIATKADLEAEREVQEEEGKKLADLHNMLFLEVSAKNGRNVEQTFLSLTREIKNNRAASGFQEETPLNLRVKTPTEGAKNCAC